MKRIALERSPPGSATWVYIDEDASLVVEFYDYGRDAREVWGNDVAYLLRVPAAQKLPLLEALRGHALEPRDGPEKIDSWLLAELKRRFGNYFEVRAWFDATGIPYAHEFDGWA